MHEHAASRKWGAHVFASFPAMLAVLLVGSLLYVWLRVEPALEYHRFGPFFYGRREFLEPFLNYPGGLASYAGILAAQLNHFNWAGALVFVLFQIGIVIAASVVVSGISGTKPGLGALVPAFVLLLLRNAYGSPVLSVSVGLLLALSACAGLSSWRWWRRPWRFALASGLISALLFWLAGFWPALTFAALSGLYAWFPIKHWRAGIGCVALALVPPGITMGTGNLDLALLVNPFPSAVNWGLAAVLYGSAPAMAMLLAAFKPGYGPAARSLRARAWLNRASLRPLAHVAVFLLAWIVVWAAFDRREKLLAEMDFYTSSGQYGQVLAAAKQARVLNHPARVRLQFALYHTGRLAEDLFTFLNRVDLEPSEKIGEDWRAQAQPLLELGLINDAEHMAYEALEIQGDRPDLLRLLARINLLKNRPEAAQVFLNVLSLIPFQGEDTSEAWPAGTPINAAERACLDQMRARTMTNDVPHDSVGPLLDVLLLANPTNRMAFEYAMAHDLTELDLKSAVDRLALIGQFPYPQIPRAYEEAVLLFEHLAGVSADLGGRSIQPSTIARFRRFREFGKRMQGNSAELVVMAAHFGDTYWCYYYANLMRKRAATVQASAQ
jgi:tetratricopeptide (TPR) repeat protein